MNSSTPHTDAFCNPPQFANFPWGLSTVLSFYCIFLCVLENGCHLPSCGLGATVGWVGAPIFFFDQFFKEGSSLVLAVALKPLHRNLLVSGRTPAGWWRSFSTASGPGSRPSLSFLFCGGAACRCWLGTWPHDPCLGAACLCWFRALSQ